MSENILKQQENQKKFILSGSLWKVMFNLSWPAIIAMVLFGLNSVIDAAFVGYFVGETALAGVSISAPISQISVGLGSLIGVGAGSVLGIALGRNDKKTQANILPNVNFLCIVFTIVYMVLGLIFSTTLVEVMGGTGETLLLGDSYLRITILGSFFWIYGLAANMIVRAEGKMKTAAVMMGVGLVVNIIFNYIFMGLLDLGVDGSAWGTNVGMLAYTLIGWYYFSSGRATFKSKTFGLKLHNKTSKSIIGLGMSSFIMTVMTLIQAFLVFNALSKYGTTSDIAFYGVIFRLFQFALTPIFGLMRALQPAISINFGARNYKRVIEFFKIFSITSALLILPFWLITMISPSSVVGLLLPEQAFTEIQMLYARINISIIPLLSIIFMAMTFYPSIGKGKPAAILGMARQLVFYVPVMIILPKIMGVSGVYYGSFGIDIVIVLITFIMVKKEFNNLRKKDSELIPSI